MENLKIKFLTKEQIIISIDRLTRFKEPEIKYLRVFKDIISSSLLAPHIKKNDIESLEYSEVRDIATYILNSSLKNLGCFVDDDFSINQKILDYENSVFNISSEVNILLKNKISYKSALKLLNDDIPFNLKWLMALVDSMDIFEERKVKGFKYPLEKIVLAEGVTEEILLPAFAKVCGYDLGKNGVYVISAGGKNQVVKYFYRYAKELKIPIFVLLDKDAVSNYEQIVPKLRKYDKVHLLNSGEFEDLLPLELIEKTLNYSLQNISILSKDDIKPELPMAKNLEELFKKRGLHEFKKADFAKLVKSQIKDSTDVSDEIRQIFDELKFVNNNNKKGTEVPL